MIKYKLIIDEECNDLEEMMLLLNAIRNYIKMGYTTGHYPTWRVEETYTRKNSNNPV